MEKKFLNAFKDIVREEMVKKNQIEIRGLGRFKVIHEKQHQSKLEDGTVAMMPPRDKIIFTPYKEEKA